MDAFEDGRAHAGLPCYRHRQLWSRSQAALCATAARCTRFNVTEAMGKHSRPGGSMSRARKWRWHMFCCDWSLYAEPGADFGGRHGAIEARCMHRHASGAAPDRGMATDFAQSARLRMRMRMPSPRRRQLVALFGCWSIQIAVLRADSCSAAFCRINFTAEAQARGRASSYSEPWQGRSGAAGLWL